MQTSSGARFEHHVVHLPRIAIAVIVNHSDEVPMLWRHRFATDQWGYELLGVLVKADEQTDAAARKAIGERGWRPVGPPEPLVTFEPRPGQITAPIEVFLWHQAEPVGVPSDPDEAGCVEWVPLSAVPGLAADQKLLGAGTLVPLLHYLTTH